MNDSHVLESPTPGSSPGIFRRHGLLALIAAGLLISVPQLAQAGDFVSKTYNGRKYKVYVPTGYSASKPAPLLLMLHGCTQDPDSFATSTEMNTYSEQYRFLVAYPDQPSTSNSTKCWQWWDPNHQVRGKGEPADIAGITLQVSTDYAVDSSHVYLAGFSAGAAMAAIMGATYPDLYAAIGVHSGLEYKAAVSTTTSSSAMTSGGPNPDTQGQLAYSAMGSRARVVPTIVFHGTSDYTVAPVNGDQVLSQWAQTDDYASDGVANNDIDNIAEPSSGASGTVTGGRSYTVWSYQDASGAVVLQKYMVTSMGHAWSGGSTSGAYTDSKGPEASVIMWTFFSGFSLAGAAEDLVPPVTAVSPAAGTYAAPITITLTPNEAADTFYTLNGSTPTTASSLYSGPFSLASSATLKFFSIDLAGNAETAKSAAYIIQTTTTDTTPPVTSVSPAGGAYSSPITITLSANEAASTYYTLDGSTPTTASSRYGSPFSLSAATTLKFFSVDTAGNVESVKTASYTFTSEVEKTFASIAAEDGYVGQLSADGYSTTVHKAGDKGMYNADTYRTLFSFDTSALPDTAVISSVKLRLYRQSIKGTVTGLKIDVAKGYFGTDATLKITDYSAAATASDVASFAVPAANNGYVDVSFPSTALELVNKVGRTQVRLKATAAADFTSDVLTVYGGEDATYKPVLTVRYR